jgi:hypothetical protein
MNYLVDLLPVLVRANSVFEKKSLEHSFGVEERFSSVLGHFEF